MASIRHHYVLAIITAVSVLLVPVVAFVLSTSADSPQCGFAITAPAEKTRVTHSGGVVVQGTACSGDSVWVFDYDASDRRFYRDHAAPLRIIAGAWSIHDTPLGNAGDPSGYAYRIVALSANSACSRQLQSLRPDKTGTVMIRRFPSLCPSTADGTAARSVVVMKR
jgi:hypothetical protein